MSATGKNWGAITSFPRESINPTLPFLTTGYRSPPVCAITQITVVSQTNRLHRRRSSVTELDFRPTLNMDTDHAPIFTVARLVVHSTRVHRHRDWIERYQVQTTSPRLSQSMQ